MQANFYYNRSDKRYLNKQLNPIVSNVDIFFKDDTDSIRPIFKMTGNYADIDANYIYVQELNKYYFIDKMRYSKQYVYIETTEDVLSTWKNFLIHCKPIITRNENLFNLYQNDDRMKVFSYDSIRTLEFPAGFNFANQQFVMGVIGSSIEKEVSE